MRTPRPLPSRIAASLAGVALVSLSACAPGAESPGGEELIGPGAGLEDQQAPPNPGEIDPSVLGTPPDPGQVQPDPAE